MADFIAPRLTDPSRIDGTVSMTSDQEAVCETCGGKGEIRYRAPHRVGEFVYTCRDCKGTGRIPAPVVPSDDGSHERDEERWLLTPGKWQPEESAPPTPSQDAEGDALEIALRFIELSCTESAKRGAPPSDYSMHRAKLSAIRAPYEALVEVARGELKNAARAYTTLARCIEHGWTMGDSKESDIEWLRDEAARLTHIEESLGGRKDG